MSNYPVPPPNYSQGQSKKNYHALDDDSHAPLLGQASSSSSAGRAGIWNQPGEGDLPDDFKVCSVHC